MIREDIAVELQFMQQGKRPPSWSQGMKDKRLEEADQIINLIVGKLTVISDDEILKIIQGTPRTSDVFNDITGDLQNTAKAQLQHTINEIRD